MEELAKSVENYMDMVEGPAEAEEDNDMHAAPTGTTAEEDAVAGAVRMALGMAAGMAVGVAVGAGGSSATSCSGVFSAISSSSCPWASSLPSATGCGHPTHTTPAMGR